jgi:hypothetical protein
MNELVLPEVAERELLIEEAGHTGQNDLEAF